MVSPPCRSSKPATAPRATASRSPRTRPRSGETARRRRSPRPPGPYTRSTARDGEARSTRTTGGPPSRATRCQCSAESRSTGSTNGIAGRAHAYRHRKAGNGAARMAADPRGLETGTRPPLSRVQPGRQWTRRRAAPDAEGEGPPSRPPLCRSSPRPRDRPMFAGLRCRPSLLEVQRIDASRSGRARGATWDEINVGARQRRIPAERMKSDRGHRVSLSDAALAVLHDGRLLSGGRGLVLHSAMRPGRP